MKRYRIDTFAGEMLESSVAAVVSARSRIKKPLANLAFWRDSSETFLPQELLVYWAPGKPAGYRAANLVLTPDQPKSNIPFSLFQVEERGDKVQAEFLKAHKLKGARWWEDALALPRLLVAIELHKAFSGIRARLEEKKIAVASRFNVYDADPDGMEPVRVEMGLDDAVRDRLKAMMKTRTQLTAFAELCYSSRERQEWLTGLGQ